MNEKLLEIAESVARIEATLSFVSSRLDRLEKTFAQDHEAIVGAKSIYRAAVVVATVAGAGSALAVELLVGR